jgi:hypothetical protein
VRGDVLKIVLIAVVVLVLTTEPSRGLFSAVIDFGADLFSELVTDAVD